MRVLTTLVVTAILLGIARDHVDWERLLVPYRVARFYAEPADTQLLLPVKGVALRSIADTWQASRPGRRRHHGQDIFAKRGTPVVAAADGVVTKLGGGELGGNAVFVTGRGARTYYYAHLDDYVAGIEVGQLVEQGSIVGYVGNTGNARTTPSHLHFGIYTATGPINPLPLFTSSQKRTHRVESM